MGEPSLRPCRALQGPLTFPVLPSLALVPATALAAKPAVRLDVADLLRLVRSGKQAMCWSDDVSVREIVSRSTPWTGAPGGSGRRSSVRRTLWNVGCS